jgi:predicted transcriptional regulator
MANTLINISAPNTKLQQTARKLGLSVQSLEQYLAVKAAEVSPRQPTQPRR